MGAKQAKQSHPFIETDGHHASKTLLHRDGFSKIPPAKRDAKWLNDTANRKP
jgi:hypothetical protein